MICATGSRMKNEHLDTLVNLNELALTKSGSSQLAESFISKMCGNPLLANPWEVFHLDSNELAREIYANRGKPLAGLIFGAKDIIATENFSTSMGTSSAWQKRNMGFDARIISLLKSAGAVVGGKTKTSEFAVHKETDVVNPRYPGYSAGTSSSGSAAAIANQTVKLAIGTQTAGSIARPASYCGVIAIKPTFGLLPRTGVLKTCDELDTIGFFGDSISLIREVLQVVQLQGENYPTLRLSTSSTNSLKRILLLTGEGFDQSDLAARDSVKTLSKKLANQLKIEFVDKLNDIEFEGVREILSQIYRGDLAHYFRDEITSGVLSNELLTFIGKTERNRHTHEDLLQKLNVWRKAFRNLLSDTILITLAANSGAPRQDATFDYDMNLVLTAAGLPQLILPDLVYDSSGKSVGISFSTSRFSEATLFSFVLENVTQNSKVKC
jgi:Asp-tRNA(Asn)/Glu-tRNA(Gln) amidotransferase A subunit family amidase